MNEEYKDFKFEKWFIENLMEVYSLESKKKNLIFQEFKKFIPQTSIRQFIKEISNRVKVSEELLQFFFWRSYDIHILELEYSKSFDNFFNNALKMPLINEYPELSKSIEDFEDFKEFFSQLPNIINFEYYKVFTLEEINQINIGFSNIVSLYLFKINDKLVLIDAGWSLQYWKNSFFKALDELKVALKDIDYCIITHEHPDHIGLVADLKKANPEVKICLHKMAHELAKLRLESLREDGIEERIKDRADLLIRYGFEKEEVNLMTQRFGRGGMGFEYIKPDLLLNNDDRIVDGELQIVHSPGHSVGHICVHYPKKGILFSGDHILSKITPHLGTLVIPGAEEFNKKNNFQNILEHYLRSLDIIDELNSRIILPGHEQIIYNPHKRITAIKNHHQNRLYEISRIIQNSPLPPLEIALQHFGEDLDQMNKILAISETLVHLDYLEFQNKVEKKEKDGVLFYWSEELWQKIKYS
ncbi:MAG: MBL fold metallo-hydrolase [Candidatus Lokiarchaeota archaeon]|nr:MBL fold metallo-hydrolase [Candidatus Lokiarchaeota archaeon]